MWELWKLKLVLTEEGILITQATKEGEILCKWGGVCDLSYPKSQTRRGRVQGGGDICPTITAESTGLVRLELGRVRARERERDGNAWK